MVIYVVSMYILKGYFNWTFITSWEFVWRVAVVTGVSCLPIYMWRLIKRKLYPPSYTKLLEK
jgi:phospholipid-translocating ATPase